MRSINSLSQRGYVLIGTLVLGLGISIAASTFLQYIVSSSVQLNDQTYTALAEEAAEAGSVLAANCIGQYSSNWSELKPNTSCDGVTQGSPYVMTSTTGIYTWRSSFSVAPYIENGVGYKLAVTGTLDVLRGAARVKQYSVQRSSTIAKFVYLAATSSPSAKQVTDLSVDTHSCAIANGELYCWGNNSNGQLGDGTLTSRNTPTRVSTSGFLTKTVTKVVVGTLTTCAIADGQLYCWGDNSSGQLGQGNYTQSPSPLLVSNPIASLKVTDVSISQGTASPATVCAVANGTGYCWGRNTVQQAGRSTASSSNTANQPTPGTIFSTGDLNGKKVSSISVGESNGCAIASGKLYCWGGQASPASPPKLVTDYPYNLPGIYVTDDALEVKAKSMCTTMTLQYVFVCRGQSRAWTANAANLIPHNGGGFAHALTTNVVSLNGRFISDVSVGYSHACAIADGQLYCWGSNGSYELGNTTTSSQYPVLVPLSGTVTAVSAGKNFTCAIVDGVAKCWGANNLGQLGTGSTSPTRQATPSTLSGVGTMAAATVSAGDDHACALLQGKTYCWGSNSYSQIGNGTSSVSVASPYQVNSGAMADGRVTTSVSAGGSSSCNIANGLIQCWGNNDMLQSGHNTASTISAPLTSGWYRYEKNLNKGILY